MFFLLSIQIFLLDSLKLCERSGMQSIIIVLRGGGGGGGLHL